MKKIILATTSPYRQAAFKSIGLKFEAIGSDIEEKFDGRPSNPDELVQELAKQKAEAVAKKCIDGIIIGFDSVGWFEGEILEKPRSKEEIIERLKKMSGKTFTFHTGIFLIDKKNNVIKKDVVKTEAKMRNISEGEIEKYLKQDDKFTTYALGFDPQCHYSSVFINEIKGSYNNLLQGIPLERIMEMLQQVGMEI